MRQFYNYRRRTDTFSRALAELNAFETAMHQTIRETGGKGLAIEKWMQGENHELGQRRKRLAELEEKMKSYGSHKARILHDLLGASNARTVMRHKLTELVDAAHEPGPIDVPRLNRALDRANAALKFEHGRMKKAAKTMNLLNAELDRILASINKRKSSNGLL